MATGFTFMPEPHLKIRGKLPGQALEQRALARTCGTQLTGICEMQWLVLRRMHTEVTYQRATRNVHWGLECTGERQKLDLHQLTAQKD